MEERLEWAQRHDAEARRIAEKGALLVRGLLSDDSRSCFWAMLLARYIPLERRREAVCAAALEV